jgi:hypothetical protein
VALSVVFVELMSCQSSEVECTCADPSLHVRVPAARAASVVDVLPSGPACAGAAVGCVARDSVAGACVDFAFRAVAAGACHVDVDFAAGAPRFSADVQMAAGDECCGGFYAQPLSGGDIDVPAETADAGGAG